MQASEYDEQNLCHGSTLENIGSGEVKFKRFLLLSGQSEVLVVQAYPSLR
jgi:hypothetical protein